MYASPLLFKTLFGRIDTTFHDTPLLDKWNSIADMFLHEQTLEPAAHR